MNFSLQDLYEGGLTKWQNEYGFDNGEWFYEVSTGRVIDHSVENDQIYVFQGNFCIVDAYNNCNDVLLYCNAKYTLEYVLMLRICELGDVIAKLQDSVKSYETIVDILKRQVYDIVERVKSTSAIQDEILAKTASLRDATRHV